VHTPDREPFLEGLTAAQRAAVLSDGAPICVLAAAGAGKTRVLTTRIAYRVAAGLCDPRHVLALTFTRKAAREMQQRLQSLGMRSPVASGTFHSVAFAQLQRWWADRRQPAPTLVERKSRLLGPLAAARPGVSQIPLSELASHIEWARARLVRPDQLEEAYERERRSPPEGVSPEALAALYARYEHEKRRRGLVDFDDLLSACAGAIEADPEFAAAQRWRWRHVFVDEFQDLNPLQHHLLVAWLGPSTDLCVVGDPHQAIYGWNGSDPHLLDEVPLRWPSTSVVRLDANHRCTVQIVSAASSVLGDAGSHLTASGREGPDPDVRAWPCELAEASAIASAVVRSHATGRPLRAMAVLARTNAQLVPIHDALESAGIAVWAPSRAAVLDDPAARRVIASFRRRGHLPIQVLVSDLEELSTPISPGAPGPASQAVELCDEESRGAIAVMADLARSFAAEEPGANVTRWLSWLPTATRDGAEPVAGSDAITICSFHRAKGLEWDEVWVAGLERGLVPIGRALTESAEAEERRLLYVALTRADTDLHCSWARQRTFAGRAVPREPSPWLDAIRAPFATEKRRSGQLADASSWRERVATQRRSLSEASRSDRGMRRSRLPEGYPEPDRELAKRIKAWRLDTARTSGVPPYVVLHDVTVDAIAALRPATSEELLAVPGLGPVKACRYGPSLLALVDGSAKAS
jgi:DNA helicase-2/ATP-dependent DNA helicase PcrA